MLRCARLQGRCSRPALRCLSTVRNVRERFDHPLPEPLSDTLPDHNWHAYEERYSAIHRTHKDRPFVVADVIKQRTHERRYEWGTILLQTFRTSPTAVGASLRNMLYTSAIVTPYCAVQWRDSLGALDLPPAVLDCLSHPQLEMAVDFLNTHQGSLIAAFGVYSTALFLLLSMRLTSAVRYYNDGVLAFSDLCAQTSNLTSQSQLYFTDKRACTEVCLWAYAACRATEAEMHKITGEEARAMYEHLLLRHGDGVEEPAGDDELAEREASLAYLLGAAEQKWRVEMLVNAQNAPVFALQQLTAMLRVAFDRGLITNIRALIATHSSVEKMVLAHAACQRVQLTPEPYSYTALMKTSSVLWAAGVPLVLMPTLQLATIPMGAMLSFFVAKLDEISAELQNPYGYDISDVGMGAINRRLQRELRQSTLLYNQYDTPVDGSGNAMDAAIDAGDAIKLGLPGVGDWKDNEKLWKAARLGGGKAVHAWPSSP
jgi:predicted membrane chloride channel (bestrophin family)